MDDGLAEFMGRVWTGFRKAGSARAVDRRTQRGVLAYVEALRSESTELKNFRGLARILDQDPSTSASRTERLQRAITDRDWDPDAVLEAAATVLTPRLIPEALVLRNVNTTRLGEHYYRKNDGRPRQRALMLALAARIPDGDVTLLILRWRLGIEPSVWGPRAPTSSAKGRTGDAYARFKVPEGVERVSIPSMGAKAIADARRWPDLDLPVVGGATFAGIRKRWRRTDVPYIVEWMPSATASLRKALEASPGVKAVHPVILERSSLLEMFLLDHEDGREVILQRSAPRGHREDRAVRTWCTNMFDGEPDARSIKRALDLGDLRFTLQPVYRALRDRYGLNDYRGVSYVGWHRHAALVALAHSAEVFSMTMG